MSVRRFNAAGPLRKAAAVLGTLAILGFLASRYVRVRDGHGVVPYISAWGVPTYPVAALTLAVLAILAGGLGALLGWRKKAGAAHARSHRD